MAGPGETAGEGKPKARSVRLLRYLASSRIDRLRDQVWASLVAWAGEWGIETSMLTLGCERAWEQPELAQQPWQAGAQGVWLAGAGALARHLAGIWWGSEAGRGTLAEQSSSSAATHLTEQLVALAAGGSTPASEAADCFAHASGAVLLQIGLANFTLRVLLADPDALLGAPPVPQSLPKPVPVHRGIGKQPVPLQVEVGQSVVPLSALMTLAVGDVIRLDSPIEQPARILAPGAVPLFAGYLGKVGDSVAVELTASTKTS